MSTQHDLTLFHAPNTRSTGVLILLEELRAAYRLEVLNMKAGEHRAAKYLSINPMGKVPAIQHGDARISEQVALYIYLADLYPEAALAPAIGDDLRGPYLRWIAFYGSCFEPALIDRHMKRDPAPQGMCPYGDYDTMFGTLVAQLTVGPYLLGERFLAVDVLWATALRWMLAFKLIPADPVVVDYASRVNKRPIFIRVATEEAQRASLQNG